MILIGQYDSPFVRRVAIALSLYGFDYEHRPWSVFSDADKIRAYNPLTRVPTLILGDGTVIIESAYILDYLDEAAGEGRAMLPASGPLRQKALYLTALSTGLGDKAVSLFYEQVLHKETSDLWLSRCLRQISAVLDILQAERQAAKSPWLLGAAISHADIALACALRFVDEVHAEALSLADWPDLKAHSQACEAMEVFQRICQPFTPPK